MRLRKPRYGVAACFAAEFLLTFFFLFIIIGTTSKGAATGFAGIPIGLALTLIHLVSIPITNTSVNLARSTGAAIFAGAPMSVSYGCSGWRRSPAAGALGRIVYEDSSIEETIVVEERRVS